MMSPDVNRFPHAFEVETPRGAEGWESMYPYWFVFTREPGSRRDWESKLFWFKDNTHIPQPIYPFDAIHPILWEWTFSEFSTRIFTLPTVRGYPFRVLNGYVYVSNLPVEDPKEIERRTELFKRRAGYYYQNWNRIYEGWKSKVFELTKELEKIEFHDLPEIEDESVVFQQLGYSKSSYELYEGWHRLFLTYTKLWHMHFEMLNIGYGAYLLFYLFCKEKFPEIPDKHIARMVSGIESVLFRPERECRRLARLAVELGLSEIFLKRMGYEKTVEELRKSERGRNWLDELEKAKYPWFYFTTGVGFYHTEPRWIDNMDIPFKFITDYIERLLRGENIDPSTERIIKDRDEITERYKSLLKSPDDIKAFEENLQLARTVFPYLEDHNFYIDIFSSTIMYRKVRELSKILVKNGILKEVDDIFYMNPFEIGEVVYDLCANWAVGDKPMGSYYWPREIERRKKILEVLRRHSPPPALGKPPEAITDPILIMLWGITTERVKEWLSAAAIASGVKRLTGIAASPGIAEGAARVISSPEEILKVKDGEILVAPTTAPSWNVVFGKIKAAVTDIGGLMSHAAIVAREYGLPAVVGVGYATQVIKDGMKIRVNGDEGVVEILEG